MYKNPYISAIFALKSKNYMRYKICSKKSFQRDQPEFCSSIRLEATYVWTKVFFFRNNFVAYMLTESLPHSVHNNISSKRIELETSGWSHIVANFKLFPLLSTLRNIIARKRRIRSTMFDFHTIHNPEKSATTTKYVLGRGGMTKYVVEVGKGIDT